MASMDIGLDSSVLAGRMQRFSRREYARRETPRIRPRGISDVFVVQSPPEKVQTTITSQPTISTPKVTSPKQVIAPPTIRGPQASTVLARQYTAKSLSNKPKFQLHTSTVLTALAVLLLLVGAGVAAIGFRTNRKVVAQVQQAAQSASEEEGVPAEEKPNDSVYGSYSVAPDLPRYIRIPKLGVSAMVRRQGIDKKGALQSPSNIHVAGWYEGSSKPGEGGAMLIDGHVAGPTQSGVFNGLKKLVAGDKIEVERGDGKVFTFKMVKVESKKADQVDMSAALLSVVPGKSGLNLITCTGKITGTQYDERLVLYAVQI